MKENRLEFDVILDKDKNPVKIVMNSSDQQAVDVSLKSLFISAFDQKKNNTLTLDLWTKDMLVNEMYVMFHQTLLSMSDTLESSTGHDKLSGALKDYCAFFAEQTEIIKKK